MKRVNDESNNYFDELVFEPEERDKFFRAIKWQATISGNRLEEVRERVAHERAHLDALIQVGHEVLIKRYIVTRTGAAIEGDFHTIPQKEYAKIALAPKKPSFSDLWCVLTIKDIFSYYVGLLKIDEVRERYT